MSQFNGMNKMSEMFQKFSKMPGMDKDAVMASHKKNLEALTEANKMAVEVMKSISQLQTQYIKQTFEDMSAIMQNITSASSSQATLAQHSQNVKDQLSRIMDHGTNISNTMKNGQREILDIMHNRFSEGMNEANDMFAHKKKTH